MMSQKLQHLGISVHKEIPKFMSDYGKKLCEDYYLLEDETPQEGFARAATAFCYGDYELAQRIYNYVYNGWMMYASPILSNAPKGVWVEKESIPANYYWHNHEFIPEGKINGMPISCFAFNVADTTKGQVGAIQEMAMLSMSGGGTGAHNSIRGVSKKAPGPIPYMKVLDSAIGYFKQGKTRKGALAYYMDSSHPDIIEHIRFRVPGGDPKRRSDNRQQFHSAVNIDDKFIEAVLNNKDYDLVCPHSGHVFETVKARKVWEEILETRAFTGEPYLLKIDWANEKLPENQKARNLKVRGSNLCSEIILPTDEQRTFVCCLSSLNLERFDEWKDTQIVEDLRRFLDNVVQFFIDHAPQGMEKAVFSAQQERAVGIGTLGFHSYLQRKRIPFESGGFNSAVQHTHKIYSLISERARAANRQLAKERGEAPDMIGSGLRGSKDMAIAPNASSADIANSSPSIEPWYRNCFIKESRAGKVLIKNPVLELELETLGLNTEEVWDKIKQDDGRLDGVGGLPEWMYDVYKVAMQMDQHWIVELADARGGYIDQAQSLNLFFPPGSDRAYVNSVHIKFLKSKNVGTLYYYRTEREGKVDKATQDIQRVALQDWNGDACIACEG